LSAPAGSLAYLRSYGFKTFDSVWSESYDLATEDLQRVQLLTALIYGLDQKSEQEKNEMAKARASEENLLVGINRLNTTMDKILTEIKATATATEATNKSLNNTKFLRTN
jgi:phage shock protein A